MDQPIWPIVLKSGELQRGIIQDIISQWRGIAGRIGTMPNCVRIDPAIAKRYALMDSQCRKHRKKQLKLKYLRLIAKEA